MTTVTEPSFVVLAEDHVNGIRYAMGPFPALSVAQAWAILDSEEKQEASDGDTLVHADVEATYTGAWIELVAQGEVAYAWTPMELSSSGWVAEKKQ